MKCMPGSPALSVMDRDRTHVEDPELGNITKESGREFCGRCHDINPARSTDVVFQVDIKTHHTEKTELY